MMELNKTNREKEPAMSVVPQEAAVSEEEWGRIPPEIEDEEWQDRLIPPDGFWDTLE